MPGIVGSAFMDALDLFPAAGIDFVTSRTSRTPCTWPTATPGSRGRPSVVIAQNGPGITNFVTGVAAAYWAHTPMVVVTPSAGTLGVGLGGFQETEQMPIFSKITKWQVQVNRPERMAELMRRAFYVAKAESGPVQVDIPRDYFYAEGEYEIYPSATIEPRRRPADQVRAGGPSCWPERATR